MYRSIHTERPLNYCVLSFQIFLGRGLKGHEKSRTLFKVRLQLAGDTWFESILKAKTG